MSDVKRLLAEATSLPWTTHGSRIYYRGPGGGSDVLAENDLIDRSETLAKINTTGRWKAWEADAALIVHAVNHLPNYEAAVDALERITKAAEMARRNLQGTTPCYCASSPHEGYCGDLIHATAKARAALRRLRDEVPA